MRKRTRSREFALQLLYRVDLNRADELADVFEDFWTERTGTAAPLTNPEKEAIEADKKDPEVRAYAQKLVSGTLEHLDTIDKTIERFAENWDIKRMAFVDRNILRLSTFEMVHIDDIPVKVAINEAVELAKRYGEPDSSKFVNGILDKIAKNECRK